MTIIENIERVLRQSEALEDNLEHPSTETMIESKLPPWVLNKVDTRRKLNKSWTIQKLRGFLSDLVEVNQQVNLGRNSTSQIDNKLTRIKGELTQLSTDSPTFMYHTTSMVQTDTPQETLLLCKEMKVINPEHPRRKNKYTLVQSKVAPMIVGS
ncbi:unnamed protein product, partial [Onchocerca flexuosa]|uniref:Uncharacterized protein n=1 Tax=Onchocerca flexuosa TaxID=387005 RepID=A0A183HW56_9BILA